MDTKNTDAQITISMISLVILMVAFSILSVYISYLFVFILSFLGMMFLLISLTLHTVDVYRTENAIQFIFKKEFNKFGLLRAMYVLSCIAVIVIGIISVKPVFINGIPSYNYNSNDPICLTIITIISTIYVKLIGRSIWYGLTGILGIIGVIIVTRLTPKHFEEKESFSATAHSQQ